MKTLENREKSVLVNQFLRCSETTVFFFFPIFSDGLLNELQPIGLLLDIPRILNGEGDFAQSFRWTPFGVFACLANCFHFGREGGGGAWLLSSRQEEIKVLISRRL